jgi:acyl-CoA hydrolase
MPRTRGPAIHIDRIDHRVDTAAPLLEIEDRGDIPESIRLVSEQIAQQISDGATLQFGLGKMQRGILEQLQHHRELKVHSGMVSDPLLLLAESNALSAADDAVCCGVALGTQSLYDFCTTDPRVRFASVGETHQTRTLQQIKNLVCINSCIEVDLLGQVNGETINGQQISGTGGLVDFGRGARLAPGGKYILATPATAKGGSVSRIVPRLGSEQLVSVTRQDVDLIITEYGCANLRYKSVQQRARALIDIAAPQFRESLEREWHPL